MAKEPQLCQCGCGDYAKPGNKYINGHNSRGKNNPNYGKFGKDNPLYGRHLLEDDRIKKSNAAKKRYENQKEHEKTSKACKEAWKDQELKQKRIESMKAVIENYKYNVKICITCGEDFIPNSGFQLYCKECTPGEYCYRYDENCKEHNREKYNRECFICGKTEKENGRKLDTHHVDYNKRQGCDDINWKLVPLCMSCHGITNGSLRNREIWEARLYCLIDQYWSD